MKLSDRIWLTKKCRMESENRLNRYDTISKLLITYYSLFIIILSLSDIINCSENFNFSIISYSILILILSLIVSSMRFKERALSYKQCYIKLNELLHEATQIEEKSQNEEDVFKKYNEILNLTENHSEIDYYKVKYYDKSIEKYLSLSKKEFTKLLFHWIKMLFFFIVLILSPFIILYFDN